MRHVRDEAAWLRTWSQMILAAVAVGFVLYFTSTAMIPFVLAVLIAHLSAPLQDVLVKHFHAPGPVAVAVVMLVVLIVLALFGGLLYMTIGVFVDEGPVYYQELREMIRKARPMFAEVGIALDEQDPLYDLLERVDFMSWASSMAGTVATAATELLTMGTLVMIFVLYLVAGRQPMQPFRGIEADIDEAVRRYIVKKIAISAVTGVLVGLILAALGLRMALVFGVLAFLLNFIPSIGSVIATAVPIPIALVQYGDNVWMMALVVLLPGTVQMTIGNVIEPKIMGEGLELHPVTVLVALIIWGLLWGIVGTFLAAPLTAVLRIVLDRIETTRPIADMMAGRPGKSRDEPPGEGTAVDEDEEDEAPVGATS